MVNSAGEQTELAREEEDGEHDIVRRQNVVVLGLGQNPHVDVCDRPYQYRAYQVGVYVASLVVEVGQAKEDGLIVWRLWTIAGVDELVVSRPVLNILVDEELGPCWGMNGFLLGGAHIGGWRASFLEVDSSQVPLRCTQKCSGARAYGGTRGQISQDENDGGQLRRVRL